MTNLNAVLAGIVLLGIAVVGYFTPIDYGITIPQYHEICTTNIGQLAHTIPKFFGINSIEEYCTKFSLITYGIYGFGLSGIILIITGTVVSSRSKEKPLTCAYCNFIAMSESELLKHSSDKHLDKSPYKCGHCDFIGITEEILWNHYNDKHPNEKKW
jgi:hypothetical protein